MSVPAEKRLDAVRMMREIRDELSRELVKRSHEEQAAYLREQLNSHSRPAQRS